MNYGELQQTVKDYMHRIDLDDQIPNFIETARTRINRDLRVREMLVEAKVTFTTNPFPLVAGFLEMRDIYYFRDSRRCTLRMIGRDRLNLYAGQLGENQPQFYSIDGLNIETAPGGQDLEFTQLYFTEELAFADDLDTRLTLDQYPSVWLYSSLIEAHSFTQDLELQGAATDMYTSELRIANDRSAEAEAGPAIAMQGASNWL